jgi:replicative DNA helicase
MEYATEKIKVKEEIDRSAPFSYEAEVSVLGGMLLDKLAITKALERLDKDCFYHDSHREIFDNIRLLFEKNQVVDIVTLTEQLRKRKKLDIIGGQPYLLQILNAVPTAANVEYYAGIVLEKAILRKLLETSTDIINEVYTSKEDVENLLDRAEQMIFQISEQKIKGGFIPIKKILHPTFEMIEMLHQKKGRITGVETGFTDLDNLTAGFQNADLVVIAGRPSMGKTSFALNIAQYCAIEVNVPAAIFSLEMSKEQLVQRLLSSVAGVDAMKLRTGFLGEKDWPKLAKAAGILGDAPIYIDDSPLLTVLEMRAKARRLKSEVDLGLVIVDYLQLMKPGKERNNRQEEISIISRSLKALAKELGIPVIAISQLSREPEKRPDKRPTLADLRESGAIEQDADVVIFIYREEVYKSTPGKIGEAEIIIGKQRNGPVGKVKLTFLKKCTRFMNYSPRKENA